MASSATRKHYPPKIQNQSFPFRRDFLPVCGEPHSGMNGSSSSLVSRDRLARNVVSSSGLGKETLPGTSAELNRGKEVSNYDFVLSRAGVSVFADGVRLNRARPDASTEELSLREESRVRSEEVKSVLEMFWKTYKKHKEENAAEYRKDWRKTIIKTAMALKRMWLNTQGTIGSIPGVEIGDRFQLRAELKVIGLHCQFENGIDYTKKDGNLLATSIVVTERYDNYVMRLKKSLIYIGQGGNPRTKRDQPLRDQKLERGNLALKNSIAERNPVRVILRTSSKEPRTSSSRHNSSQSNRNSEYVYDGLYNVDKCWQRRGKSGKLVFQFLLNKCADQPQLSSASSIKSGRRKRQRECVLSDDISKKKEYVPIRVVSSFDGERPPSFTYITNVIHPVGGQSPLDGCECDNGCSDSEDCVCKIRNGGGIPYHYNQAVKDRKSLIYECGPSCRCYKSCINRVSQRGIRLELEVFRTPMGWSVRSRSYIPAGRFVCELVGEVRRHNETAESIGREDYLFEVRTDRSGLNLQQSSGHSSLSMENDCFIIDATRCGNVGRFIKHSSSPNLYAQRVLYGTSDVTMPHLMLFAIKDIPAQQELTWNYKLTII